MGIRLDVTFTGLRFENPFLLASAPPMPAHGVPRVGSVPANQPSPAGKRLVESSRSRK
jgi:hypothetical protein